MNRFVPNIKKTVILVIKVVIYIAILWLLSSCGITSIDEEKIDDIEYEIIEYYFMDSELREIYDEAVMENKRISYTTNGEEYLIICYGEQPTNGYTIKVKELYETKHTIVIDTTLIGPPKDETIVNESSYPALVIKIKEVDKNVIYK